jgi:hypothetical protein
LAYDVFISYASKDKPVADAVCARLESAGVRCWIAPRDITAGTSYGEAIIEAIHGAKAMVLVFSSNANLSGHIPKEVERAVSRGLTIIPYRIEDVAPGKSLDYFIGSVHWLDALTPPMEKHLDDLAATVKKLLSAPEAKVGGQVTQTSGVWQREDLKQVQPPHRGGDVGDNKSQLKGMLIGSVAIIAVFAVVLIMVLMRTGNSAGVPSTPNTQNGPDTPATPANSGPSTSSPAVNKPSAAPAAAKASAPDPIVGCYIWFNGAQVVIRADGSMTAGPFTASWRVKNAARREYAFTWPEAVDTVTVPPGGRSLNGGNQYGYPTSGAKISGGDGLVGVWRWANGVPVTVNPDGTFTAANFRGRWALTNTAAGTYTLTWPNPVDTVTLSGDGSRISGSNQYGVAISGTRGGNCAGN